MCDLAGMCGSADTACTQIINKSDPFALPQPLVIAAPVGRHAYHRVEPAHIMVGWLVWLVGCPSERKGEKEGWRRVCVCVCVCVCVW